MLLTLIFFHFLIANIESDEKKASIIDASSQTLPGNETDVSEISETIEQTVSLHNFSVLYFVLYFQTK